MPSSATPGSSTSISSRQRCRHRPSPKEQRLGTPKIPAIRFTRGEDFEASTVHTFATACRFARHPVRIWPVSQPTAPFTSKLSTGQSPFPLLDMTTASTGLLCWWDSHPLEWQLASLHTPRLPDADRPAHATSDGQTWDLPASDAIRLHVMWPLTPAGRQHLAFLEERCRTCCLRANENPRPLRCLTLRGSIPHPIQQLCTLRVRHCCRLTQHSLPGGPLRPYLGRTCTG
jgi:hypothetical protein